MESPATSSSSFPSTEVDKKKKILVPKSTLNYTHEKDIGGIDLKLMKLIHSTTGKDYNVDNASLADIQPSTFIFDNNSLESLKNILKTCKETAQTDNVDLKRVVVATTSDYLHLLRPLIPGLNSTCPDIQILDVIDEIHAEFLYYSSRYDIGIGSKVLIAHVDDVQVSARIYTICPRVNGRKTAQFHERGPGNYNSSTADNKFHQLVQHLKQLNVVDGSKDDDSFYTNAAKEIEKQFFLNDSTNFTFNISLLNDKGETVFTLKDHPVQNQPSPSKDELLIKLIAAVPDQIHVLFVTGQINEGTVDRIQQLPQLNRSEKCSVIKEPVEPETAIMLGTIIHFLQLVSHEIKPFFSNSEATPVSQITGAAENETDTTKATADGADSLHSEADSTSNKSPWSRFRNSITSLTKPDKKRNPYSDSV